MIKRIKLLIDDLRKSEKDYRVVVMRDGSVRMNLDNPDVQADLMKRLESARQFAIRHNIRDRSEPTDSEQHEVCPQ